MPIIHQAVTDAQIDACFPVIAELRPHLDRSLFVARVRAQMAEGYRLAYVELEGAPVAVAGFRVKRTLFSDGFLYVDDLVTAGAQRSHGHGAALLAWLRDHARAVGLAELRLDSGVQRKDAHRFYQANGLAITNYHFQQRL